MHTARSSKKPKRAGKETGCLCDWNIFIKRGNVPSLFIKIGVFKELIFFLQLKKSKNNFNKTNWDPIKQVRIYCLD